MVLFFQKSTMKILSIDAESNGLYGQAFAIGAYVTNDGGEIDRLVSRCPIRGKTNEWVAENVLPNITDIDIDQPNYTALLENFYKFYSEHKNEADVIAHIPHPVETRLFRDMVKQDLDKRVFEGPFPLIDVGSIMKSKEIDFESVDKYLRKKKISVEFEGSSHHPLYDAIAAEKAYRHLMKKEKPAVITRERVRTFYSPDTQAQARARFDNRGGW